jgi:plastocyanin
MHRTRFRFLAAALVAVAGLVLVAPAAGAGTARQTDPTDPTATTRPGPPPPVKISLGDNFFKPKKETVPAGTKITWTWDGTAIHNVTVLKGPQKFKSKNQASGKYTKTLVKPGKYSIACTLHPGMDLTVKVTK